MGSVNLWLEVGLETKNTLRYISINQMYERIGESLALALSAFHQHFMPSLALITQLLLAEEEKSNH